MIGRAGGCENERAMTAAGQLLAKLRLSETGKMERLVYSAREPIEERIVQMRRGHVGRVADVD